MEEDKLLIKLTREKQGRTQKELADIMGVSIQTYGDWERSVRPIPENRFDLVSKVTGIDKNQLRSTFGRKVKEKQEFKPGKSGSSRMFVKKIIDILPCPNNGAKFSSRKSMMRVCTHYKSHRSKCKDCRIFKDVNWIPDGVVIDENILNNK